MALTDKVNELEKSVNFELKTMYKSVANFKASLTILTDSVEKLNQYAQKRVHSLINANLGIEKILIQHKERIGQLEREYSALTTTSNDMKKRFIDFFFRIVSSAVLILIGMGLQGHWIV